MLQAQVSAKRRELFEKNNIISTEKMLQTARHYNIPYIIHISSSGVTSSVNDDYTITKEKQENMVIESGIKHCILRPTLLFGWFDKKLLGWLSRFMGKKPVFPIPVNGKFIRQPLYVKDLCEVIIKCMENKPKNTIYNLTIFNFSIVLPMVTVAK